MAGSWLPRKFIKPGLVVPNLMEHGMLNVWRQLTLSIVQLLLTVKAALKEKYRIPFYLSMAILKSC